MSHVLHRLVALFLSFGCVHLAHAQGITNFPLGAHTDPRGVVALADGSVWVFTRGSNDIVKLNGATGQVVNSFTVPSANANAFWAVLGSDGKIWFTEFNTSKIGKIDPATGIIVEIPLPAGSLPYYIVAGPDGALWFTEYGTNKIGRLLVTATSANTQLQEFTIPSANSGPVGITAGPDGAIWFTESNAGKIGRIPVSATPASPQISEFFLPLNQGQSYRPGTIAVGQDGQIWFTTLLPGFSDLIWRFPATRAPGILTPEHMLSLPANSVGVLAPGPDGAMWVTEFSLNTIARIAMSGVTTELASPATGPFGIASDGSTLYVTESTGNAIARIPVVKPEHAWSVAASGDFDGDGTQDLLWRNTNGDVLIWYMSGGQLSAATGLGNVPVEWIIAGAGDFDGGGKADIVFRNTHTNELRSGN